MKLIEYLEQTYPDIKWHEDGNNLFRGTLGGHYIAFQCETSGWDTWDTKAQIKGMVEVLEEKVKESSK